MDPVALVVLADPVALVDLRLPVARRHPILERKVLLPLPVDQADPVDREVLAVPEARADRHPNR